jgi:hypothetical protein
MLENTSSVFQVVKAVLVESLSYFDKLSSNSIDRFVKSYSFSTRFLIIFYPIVFLTIAEIRKLLVYSASLSNICLIIYIYIYLLLPRIVVNSSIKERKIDSNAIDTKLWIVLKNIIIVILYYLARVESKYTSVSWIFCRI